MSVCPEPISQSPTVIKGSPVWTNMPLKVVGAGVFALHSQKRHSTSVFITNRTQVRTLTRGLWLAMIIVSLALLWIGPAKFVIQHEETFVKLKRDNLLKTMDFFPASNPNIHYVGRWTSVDNGSRMEGPFPGVYFEITIHRSSKVLVRLHNSPVSKIHSSTAHQPMQIPSVALSEPRDDTPHCGPISLLAQIDDDDYVIFPNATSIFLINQIDLDPSKSHRIRIVAPMIDLEHNLALQVKGVYLDKGGVLMNINCNSVTNPDVAQSDGTCDFMDSSVFMRHYTSQKMLEIVTDSPGSRAGKINKGQMDYSHGLLSGVMGWEYLLGEMFRADHVNVGMDGMCLIQGCIGGTSSPVRTMDVFFQSGPPGSEQFSQPWPFKSYMPDVVVLNLGDADWQSFKGHTGRYNKTIPELTIEFEESYVMLIKAIRTAAYQTQDTWSTESLRDLKANSNLPILVIRPFRGHLEQATRSVVRKIQLDGDEFVYWVDTSGWLKLDDINSNDLEAADFQIDEDIPNKPWRLTERGNRRVAILLHAYVCPYIAQDPENCGFVPQDAYV